MNENAKGVVTASVILSVTLIICTFLMIDSLKKFQNNIFAYADTQKVSAKNLLNAQKKEAKNILLSQKKELKKILLGRESRIRNFIKNEIKSSSIEIKKAGQ